MEEKKNDAVKNMNCLEVILSVNALIACHGFLTYSHFVN